MGYRAIIAKTQMLQAIERFVQHAAQLARRA